MIPFLQTIPTHLLEAEQNARLAFDLTPDTVYGWLIYALLTFIGYLRVEGWVKSYRINQKDKFYNTIIREKDEYIKQLVHQMMEAEKHSVTQSEAAITKYISDANNQATPHDPPLTTLGVDRPKDE